MALFDSLRDKVREAGKQLKQAGTEYLAEQEYNRARQLLAEEGESPDNTEIVELLSRVVLTDSKVKADAHRLLGRVLQSSDQLEAAVDHYEACVREMESQTTSLVERWLVEQYGQNTDAYLTEVCSDLAALLQRQGRLAEAVQWCDRAVQYDRDNMTAYHTWITCLVNQGRQDAARGVLGRARAADRLGLTEAWEEDFGLKYDLEKELGIGKLEPMEIDLWGSTDDSQGGKAEEEQ